MQKLIAEIQIKYSQQYDINYTRAYTQMKSTYFTKDDQEWI